ncbi:bifunctional DNA primase/polymerase [Streptomyces sp. B1866]|uniref:bifunctional DNA primase/polymerase n=1 Tax=Streptomyces sp. B1866 TaxID=3075431 RepID=UPI00288FC857|nr:bifunctional DNA primase/polymerase [Streptomyces sp. B1866]MDT3399689.1 bifunctional DNA primase/polymerase [Streptomyces sp. B1866]
MREIVGSRRKFSLWRGTRQPLLRAALAFATEWQWPVLPGVGLQPGRARGRLAAPPLRELAGYGRQRACGCPHPDCVVPGGHPFDPGLLAASTDPRMVRWWWANRPAAPVILATGGRAPCAVSLPAVVGARALATFDRFGVRTGPVVATPTRWSLLVAPYSLEELGELLNRQAWVPSSLRFHGDGGYVALPPSQTGAGRVCWERAPQRRGGAPWLPEVATVLDALVEASTCAPDGSRLAY